MTRIAERIVAAFLAPGHVRVRDHVAWWATRHVPGIRALRARWADHKGRPGFRAWDR